MVKTERSLFKTKDPSLLDTRILCPETNFFVDVKIPI
jgi:hypothetical protein